MYITEYGGSHLQSWPLGGVGGGEEDQKFKAVFDYGESLKGTWFTGSLAEVKHMEEVHKIFFKHWSKN